VQREQAGQTTEYASVEVQADDGKIAYIENFGNFRK
jgi:hypothetical protein